MVVLKVFSQVPDVSERLVGFDRFIQEYEIVAGLNHPNIVRIYDLGIADDHAYIAMEHFPAGDLRARMKTPLPPRTAVHFLGQIASALEAIHAVRRAAPGPEARQCHAARRRHAVPDRFRPRQGERDGRRAHGLARDLRHALLHEPGAGPRGAHRRAQRPLQPGRRVLRDAHRPQALYRVDRHGGHLQAQARRASAPSMRSTRPYEPLLRRLLAKEPARPVSVGARAAERPWPSSRCPHERSLTRCCARRPRRAGSSVRAARSTCCSSIMRTARRRRPRRRSP